MKDRLSENTLMHNSNKRIAKNTLFLYIRTLIIMIISLYTSRVVLDVLGETDFGIYNLVGGIIIIFSFITIAMSNAVQRFLSFELGRNDIVQAHRIFNMSITVHVFIALIIFVLGETIGLWFVQTQLNIPIERHSAAFWVFQFSILGCCINILRIPYNASVIAYEKMSFFAYASIVDAILRLSIAVTLIHLGGDSLILYSFLMFVIIIIINLLYFFYCRKNFSICYYHYSWDKTLFMQMVSFSGWSMTESLANVGANQGINILLNLFHGVSINAALGIANQVQAAITSFVSSFQTAFSPQIVKTYTYDDKADFYKLICTSSRLSYCLVFIIAPAVLVCLSPLLNIWLTEVPKYTESFIIVFVIYVMIDALSGPLWVSVQAHGDIKKYQIIMSIIIISNIPLMIVLLLLNFSPVFVVAVRAALNFITHVVRIEYIKKYLSFPSSIYWNDVMLRCSIMTIMSLPICFSLIDFAKRGFLFTTFIFLLIMLMHTAFVAIIGLKSSERRAICNIVRNKILRRAHV